METNQQTPFLGDFRPRAKALAKETCKGLRSVLTLNSRTLNEMPNTPVGCPAALLKKVGRSLRCRQNLTPRGPSSAVGPLLWDPAARPQWCAGRLCSPHGRELAGWVGGGLPRHGRGTRSARVVGPPGGTRDRLETKSH